MTLPDAPVPAVDVAGAPAAATAASRTGTVASLGLGIAAWGLLAITVGLGLGLPQTVEQGVYSRLIAVHPPVAWVAYVAVLVTAVASVVWLVPRTRSVTADLVAGASAEIGAVFCALMLATGSIWGRPTWGVWWVWDARLTTSALLLAVVLGYLAVRRIPDPHEVRARRSAWLALAAAVLVPVNHFAVEWWRTLHQGRSLAQLTPGDDLDGRFIGAMLLGFVAMTLVYLWLLWHRVRVERLALELEESDLETALIARRAEATSGAAG